MPAPPPTQLDRRDHLGPADVAGVRALIGTVTDHDDTPPLSEHVLLHLRYGGDDPASHLLARTPDGGIVGYAHLDPTDEVAGSSAELAVHPHFRRRGIGTALVRELLARTPDGRLRLWAHGDLPAAAALAGRLGLRRARVLWQLRRPLAEPLAEPVIPAGVAVRTFEPGRDETAWLALNARAFAQHPDQGKWTAADLANREREPWFDPRGFFLAERDGRLVGFHWTKVHGAPAGDHGHAHPAIGEVYVVGVDPDARGSKLGPALTLVGLAHLRSLGLAEVMLFVDDENTAAMAMYERLGFGRFDVDVSYRNF